MIKDLPPSRHSRLSRTCLRLSASQPDRPVFPPGPGRPPDRPPLRASHVVGLVPLLGALPTGGPPLAAAFHAT